MSVGCTRLLLAGAHAPCPLTASERVSGRGLILTLGASVILPFARSVMTAPHILLLGCGSLPHPSPACNAAEAGARTSLVCISYFSFPNRVPVAFSLRKHRHSQKHVKTVAQLKKFPESAVRFGCLSCHRTDVKCGLTDLHHRSPGRKVSAQSFNARVPSGRPLSNHPCCASGSADSASICESATRGQLTR